VQCVRAPAPPIAERFKLQNMKRRAGSAALPDNKTNFYAAAVLLLQRE
jgi:hypothetical protein